MVFMNKCKGALSECALKFYVKIMVMHAYVWVHMLRCIEWMCIKRLCKYCGYACICVGTYVKIHVWMHGCDLYFITIS